MDQRLLSYLQKILNAQVYDVAIETALEKGTKLSQRLGNNVWFKREDTQPVRSFKLRAPTTRCRNLVLWILEKGVICASAGNHAQGLHSAHKNLVVGQ